MHRSFVMGSKRMNNTSSGSHICPEIGLNTPIFTPSIKVVGECRTTHVSFPGIKHKPNFLDPL